MVAEDEKKQRERELSRERNRRYREVNKEKIKERTDKWREENRERIKENQRQYYMKNKEHLSAINKAYRESHKEEMAAYGSAWYKAHREEVKETAKRWAELNPVKTKATKMRYRSKKQGAQALITDEDVQQILSHFDDSCALTGDSENLTFDHVIPLSVSDLGSVRGNIAPLRIDINSSKNKRNLFEWFSTYKESLGLEESKFKRLVAFLAEENSMSVEEYEAYYNSFFEERCE
jgi:hypothetical protein